VRIDFTFLHAEPRVNFDNSTRLRKSPIPCPSASSSLTHTFYRNLTDANDNVDVTFLVRAQEFAGDGIGNDNGLCEQGETCLRVKNYGAYQGHGNLVTSSCPALTGAFNQVKLLEYSSNGF